MNARTERRYTLDEYRRLPEDWRVDLVRGLLVREPEPGYLHGRVQVALAVRLAQHVRGYAPELVCVTAVSHVLAESPPTVRGPDVALFRRELLPAPDHAGFIPGAPEIAIEIWSPGNRASDMEEKVADYFAAGTRSVWVVRPSKRTVTVYSRAGGFHVLGARDELSGGDVLPGFRLALAELFAD